MPLALSLIIVLTVFADKAHAMHIAEGLLPAPWAIFWFAASAPFVFLGLRNLKIRSAADPNFKAMVGLVGAAVFVISCMPIPIPIAGTCSHPCGTGMAAILIGPTLSILVASVALTLQALFLAHGGLTTLGANIFAMGVVGSYVGYGTFILSRRMGLPIFASAFLAGLLSDWGTYAMTSVSLAAALDLNSFTTLFTTIFIAFIPTQLPLGIIEGFISAGAYTFLRSRRPEYTAMLAGETNR